jgi:hypothetical protein
MRQAELLSITTVPLDAAMGENFKLVEAPPKRGRCRSPVKAVFGQLLHRVIFSRKESFVPAEREEENM